MKQKTNWVALLGAPNVGKSTLLNALVGQKISIVTPKPQTTRTLIRGIKIIDDTQLIFIDSPGIFSPKNELGKEMVKLAWQSVEGVDQICLVIDAAKHSKPESLAIIETLQDKKLKYSLILNKIDLVKKPELLEFITFLSTKGDFENIFLISALKNDGLDKLLKFLKETAIQEPWPFERDQVTDAPLRFMIEEIIREKVFLNTHAEVPYNTHVKVMDLTTEEGILIIHADILVKHQKHKKILIGTKAQMIKKIGTSARHALNDVLNKKCRLYTNIKVAHKPQNTHH